MMEKLADIGVFGGSGFYKFLEDIKEVKIETPYGMPSDSLFIGKIGAHKVAFMPRHGRSHTILPHLINYRANVWAMKEVVFLPSVQSTNWSQITKCPGATCF